MSDRLRQLSIKLVLVIGASLVGLMLVEGFLPFVGLDYPLVWVPHPELGWHQIPKARRLWTTEGYGFIEINSLGYRDRERQLAKPPDTFRILALGDSMTEAVQVNLDQTFCYILEQRLQRNGQHVEVLNFGINGYSPIQELLLFKQEGPRYKPDLVILALFLDNDIAGVHPDLTVGSHGSAPFIIIDDEAWHFDFSRAKRSFEDYHSEPFYSLRKYSATYRLISNWRWQYKLNRSIRDTSVNSILGRYLLYQKPLQPEWEHAWSIFERVMLEFAAEARRQKAALVVLSAPAGQVVNTDVWRNIVAATPAMGSVDWDLEGPERRMRDFANRHGIVLVQPYKAYQAQSKGPPLFFGDIGHMTPHGHQLMAEILEAFLYKEKLVQ